MVHRRVAGLRRRNPDFLSRENRACGLVNYRESQVWFDIVYQTITQHDEVVRSVECAATRRCLHGVERYATGGEWYGEDAEESTGRGDDRVRALGSVDRARGGGRVDAVRYSDCRNIWKD